MCILYEIIAINEEALSYIICCLTEYSLTLHPTQYGSFRKRVFVPYYSCKMSEFSTAIPLHKDLQLLVRR